jgi:hypothetical protein
MPAGVFMSLSADPTRRIATLFRSLVGVRKGFFRTVGDAFVTWIAGVCGLSDTAVELLGRFAAGG